jgi:Protein of unknown function (DUF3489)/DnaJ domain
MSIEPNSSYSSASNARRAAKTIGLTEFDIYKVAGNSYKIRVSASRTTKRWWGILGVTKTATKEEITAAYRSLAKGRHPDTGGSNATAAELNIARDAGIKAAALGPQSPKTAPKTQKAQKSPRTAPKADSKATKRDQLFKMVRRGATITELTKTLGWQKHTVRAALSRLNKAGSAVTHTKVRTADGTVAHYKIAA